MRDFPEDIYTEPSDVDVDTLKNLGPLARMAGIWQGTRGLDVKPKADGTWSYDEDTVLIIRGNTEPFHHTDRNTLTRIGEPTPNPLARK